MDVYEQCVMKFLTANGSCFVSPQFDIPYLSDLDSGGSLPDFLAIRPKRKESWLVEVSATGSTHALAAKFKIADKQWIRALRAGLVQREIIDETWHVGMLAFVRSDQLKLFEARVAGVENLTIWPLEFTLQHWRWPGIVRDSEFDFRDNSITNQLCER